MLVYTRRAAAWGATALACLLVLFSLVAPDEISHLTPGAFVRVPLEGLVGVAVVLALPGGARRVVAIAVGVLLGLLAVLDVVDLGFSAVLARPFNPVLDWPFLANTVDFVRGSIGGAGADVAVVTAVLVALAVPVLMALSVLRLTRLMVHHHTTTTRVVAALTAVWVACAVLDARIVPGVPVAADSAATLAYDSALQVRTGLADHRAFAAESAVDAFRDTPGGQLLGGLRGKDVVVAFVESYGRSAIEDPQYAAQVDAVLQDGNRRLAQAGFAARSAFLTSPTAGGGSWLAHATLLSGLWISNQRRYSDLVASHRLTLPSAFARAGSRPIAVMPGTSQAWPEGAFYGYDRAYDAQHLGYRGKPFSWISSMPDQYTLEQFQRSERAVPNHVPLMAEIDLTSSHEPWVPVPRLVDWNAVGDGSVFDAMTTEGDTPQVVWRDPNRIRAAYRQTIEYSLSTLVSYLETYGDDNLVLVFLGDHQPAPVITGANASRDVPVTIVARDTAVIDRISGWGWQDGLLPGPQAPVWRMDAFRDRFLTAFK
jgi:hypothetical protein